MNAFLNYLELFLTISFEVQKKANGQSENRNVTGSPTAYARLPGDVACSLLADVLLCF